MTSERHQGSCHCGRIRFEIAGPYPEITTCDCSLCRKKNAEMVAVPETRFRLLVPWEDLSEYRWNLRIARHYFCPHCGIYTFHRKRSMPDHFGVNIHALDGFDASGIPRRAAAGREMTLAPGARDGWPGPRDGG